MDSLRLLFGSTLALLVGFSVSFTQSLGWPDALPWICAAWIGWLGGVAWVRARGW